MKKKLVKTIMIAEILSILLVGCGQKEASVSQTNVAEETVESEIVEEVQDNAEEQQEASASEFEFEEQDGKMVLVKYNGTASSVTVPDDYNGKTVTVIGDGAFRENENLQEVVLADSIKEIGEEAFKECSNLSGIITGKSIVKIEKEAFYKCKKLDNLILENSLLEIGENCFGGTGLTNISLPSGITEIPMHAFAATEIENIIIPSTIKQIGERAFEYCSSLAEVEIQEGTETIEYAAFGENEVLSIVKIPASVTEIDESAFINSNTNLTIVAPAGSYAEQYAAEQEIVFQAQ